MAYCDALIVIIPIPLAVAVAPLVLVQFRHAKARTERLGVVAQLDRLNATRFTPVLAILRMLADPNPLLKLLQLFLGRSVLIQVVAPPPLPPLSVYVRNAALVEGPRLLPADMEMASPGVTLVAVLPRDAAFLESVK